MRSPALSLRQTSSEIVPGSAFPAAMVTKRGGAIPVEGGRTKKRRFRKTSNGGVPSKPAAAAITPEKQVTTAVITESEADKHKSSEPLSTVSPSAGPDPIRPAAGDEIAAIEASLRSGGLRSAHLLPRLIAAITPKGADTTRAIHATRRALARLSQPSGVDPAVHRWVESCRATFGTALVRVVGSGARAAGADEARESAVAVAAVAGGGLWAQAVAAALRAPDMRAVGVVGECFAARYADLRAAALSVAGAGAGAPRQRLALLGHCTGEAAERGVAEDAEPVSALELRKLFGAAWTRLLVDARGCRGDMCEALRALPRALPGMARPLDVADFLKGCYSGRGETEVAIAALDPLFVLISRYGLDYPLFFSKLYALLTPEVLFRSEGNARFLEMASMFLRFGEFVPGGVIAAIVKRLVRRALIAPPAGAMWCLRLALDLLHKHPTVSFLVHRTTSLFDAQPSVAGGKGKDKWVAPYKGADPFDDDEIDPQASRAEESSLWELAALRNHISPAVSRLVLAFSKDVRKNPVPPPGNVADYASLSFADVFEAEFKRKAKKTPIAYDAPGEAPGVSDVVEDISNTLVWR